MMVSSIHCVTLIVFVALSAPAEATTTTNTQRRRRRRRRRLQQSSSLSQTAPVFFTDSGYDNADGVDSLCWITERTDADQQDFRKPFVERLLPRPPTLSSSFPSATTNTTTTTRLQASCPPGGLNISLSLPDRSSVFDDRLRTYLSYVYRVTVTLDLAPLRRAWGLSDRAVLAPTADNIQNSNSTTPSSSNYSLSYMAIRLAFCPVEGHLCAPTTLETRPESNDDNDDDDRDSKNSPWGLKSTDASDTVFGHVVGRVQRNRLNQATADLVLDQPLDQITSEVMVDDSIVVEPAFNGLLAPTFVIPLSTADQMLHVILEIDTQINVPGSFVPLAWCQFYLQDDDDDSTAVPANDTASMTPLLRPRILRVDTSNLLPERVVEYVAQPTFNGVGGTVETLSYGLVFIAAAIQAILLVFVLYHWMWRSDKLMKLSQPGPLVVLLGAGLVATFSSPLYNPLSDGQCYLQGPLTLIPIQLQFAIVVGRLRRIRVTMAPLLNWAAPNHNHRNVPSRWSRWSTLFAKKRSMASSSSASAAAAAAGDSSSAFGMSSANEMLSGRDTGSEAAPREPLSFAERIRRGRQSNIRNQYTPQQLWTLVALLTLPVAVVEVLFLFLVQPDRSFVLNNEGDNGRYECGSESEQRLLLLASAIVYLTLFEALREAYLSRNLPAIFNEVESVSTALLVSFLGTALGTAIVVVTDNPHTRPEIPYLMQVGIVLNITTNLGVRLVLPKLRLIWKGEKVAIHRILKEHRLSRYGTNSNPYPQSSTTRHGGGGADEDEEEDPSAASWGPPLRQRATRAISSHSSDQGGGGHEIREVPTVTGSKRGSWTGLNLSSEFALERTEAGGGGAMDSVQEEDIEQPTTTTVVETPEVGNSNENERCEKDEEEMVGGSFLDKTGTKVLASDPDSWEPSTPTMDQENNKEAGIDPTCDTTTVIEIEHDGPISRTGIEDQVGDNLESAIPSVDPVQMEEVKKYEYGTAPPRPKRVHSAKRISFRAEKSDSKMARRKKRSMPITIRDGEQPPDMVMRRLLQHSNNVRHVSERVVSGLNVDWEEWKHLQISIGEVKDLLDRFEQG